MKEDKLDGYVAWHPEWKIRDVALSKSSCVERLTGTKMHDFVSSEEYFITKESEFAFLQKQGWRIRPVKLVFLDEDTSNE